MGFFRKESDVISYTIDKGFTNNLAISVQNGQVAVTAPWYISRRKIEQVISEKKNWIIQKIREYEELTLINKSNLENRIIKVFGEDYNLKITYKLINYPELNMENKLIKINLPIKYKNTDNEKIIAVVLEKFYKQLAEKEVEEIMEKVRISTGLAPDNYIIEKMNDCLGKYVEENKSIIINYEIVKYDKKVMEYVILHEFCHLKYKIY